MMLNRLRRKHDDEPANFLTTHLSNQVMKTIDSHAKASASANWTPTDEHPEPPELGIWDSEIRASQARQREEFHLSIRPQITIMARWLAVEPAHTPMPGSVGPQARSQATRAQQYFALREAKDDALTGYDTALRALNERLEQLEALRLAGRVRYWSTMTEYHHAPDKLTDFQPSVLDGIAYISIDEHPTVIETRRRTSEH